jgi:CelD/BcsL family acetyltransferase involved in cellulose biosynthesis
VQLPAAPHTGTPAAGPSSAPHGRLVRVVDADEDLVRRWHRLAEVADPVNPYVGPAVTLAAAAHLDGVDQARLLVVEEDDELVFVLPVTDRRRYSRVPVRVTTLWEHDYCFLGTPLMAPAAGVAVWQAAFDVLAEAGGAPWLALDLLDRRVADLALEAAALSGRAATTLRDSERAVVHRRPTDDYVSSRFSGRRRKELRRRWRQLAEELGAEPQVVERVDVEAAVEQFMTLEAAGWKGRDGGAFAVRPGHPDFLRRMCRELADQGSLQFLSLQTQDRVVAMACNILGRDTVLEFKIAYDETAAAHSPGLLLRLEQFSIFHRLGMAIMDTCAVPDNATANRLYPDRRRLTTLLVQVGGRRGRWAVKNTHRVLAAVAWAKRGRDRCRELLGKRRSADEGQ